MTIFLLCLGAAVYLGVGWMLAYAMDGSIALKMPRWLQMTVVILLWPLSLVILIYAFMSWITGGSH